MIKTQNLFKDYLKSYYNVCYNKKSKDKIFIVNDSNNIYFHNGKMLVRMNLNSDVPFISEKTTSVTYDRMCKCYCEDSKQVHIVENRIEIIDGISVYVIADIFDNIISYVNKNMLDRWIDLVDTQLYMNNLSSKEPIYFKDYSGVYGLILPIMK